MSRCYSDRDDESGCNRPAKYEARVNWTAGVMLFCEEHAAAHRGDRDVLEIRTLRDAPVPGQEQP